MKKSIMSLGALLLSGAILASCTTTGAASIKKPNKGKATDNVSFKAYDRDYNEKDYSFKKDDSFDDVMKALTTLSTVSITRTEDEESFKTAYSYKTTYDINATRTNYFDTSLGEFGAIIKKYTTQQKVASSGETYFYDVYNSTKEENTIYYKDVSSMSGKNVKDKYSTEISYKSEDAIAGVTTSNKESGLTTSRFVDGGVYSKLESKVTSKGVNLNETESTNTKVYKYLNASEKATDPTYGSTYYAYDVDGTEYSYKISSFLSPKRIYGPYTKPGVRIPYGSMVMTSVDISTVYNEDYKDYFKGSVELTDKYIIIKATSTFDESIYSEAYSKAGDNPTEDQVKAKYDELLNNDYKGTKVTFEIWIDYTNDYYGEEGLTEVSFGYLKYEQIRKQNSKGKYDAEYFDDHGIYDEDTKNSLKDLEYTTKGSSVTSGEVAISGDDYSKKIDSMKNTCKKNNIFDKLTFDVGLM